MSFQKATGATVAAVGPRQDHTETNAPIVSDDPAAIKDRSHVAALLALHGGYQLHELSCGGFVIARHDFSAFAPDLRAVKCWAQRLVGGPQH